MKLAQYTLRFVVLLTLALAGTVGSGLTQAWAYAHNVTCAAGRNACDGAEDEAKPVVWDRSCVLFYMDKGGSDDFPGGPDGQAHPALEEIVKKSFGAWNNPECSGLQLIYGGMKDPQSQPSGERRNLVTFQQENWSQTSRMTFATTVVNYNPQTGAIREADIRVNDQFYDFTTGPSPGPGEADLQNTLTHEVGHFLGMAHSDVAEATMFGSAAAAETHKRTLHRDDVDGLCAQYPISEYSGTCGQGDSDDQDNDGGSEAFNWGGGDEQPESKAACSVTSPGSSAMISPMVLLIVGFFGGALWRRRSRRNSVD